MGAGTRRRAGNAVFCVVLLGLTLGALGHVAVHAKKVEVALLLANEQALHDDLQARQRHLRNQIRQLKDPRRLVYVAQTKLGMTPRPVGIRVVPARPGRGGPAAGARVPAAPPAGQPGEPRAAKGGR